MKGNRGRLRRHIRAGAPVEIFKEVWVENGLTVFNGQWMIYWSVIRQVFVSLYLGAARPTL